MNPQKYVINIRPGVGIPPTVNVSQGDIERPLLFTIMDGLTPLAIDSEHTTVTITGTKPSGLGYTITGDIDGSDVTFYTTEEMTQEPGFIRSELIVTGTGSTFKLGSANFDLVVEPTTHGTGVIDGTTEDARTVLARCEEYASDAAASAAEAASEAGAAATAGATAGTAAAEAVVDDIEAEISDLKSDFRNNDQYALSVPWGGSSSFNDVNIVTNNDVIVLNGTASKNTLFAFGADGTIGHYSGFSDPFFEAAYQNQLKTGHKYRLYCRMVDGTLTKSGTTYTPQSLWAYDGNFARAFIMREDASAAGHYIIRAGIGDADFTVTSESGKVGGFLFYVYANVTLTNAKFIIYVKDLGEIQKSSANIHESATNWSANQKQNARNNIDAVGKAEIMASIGDEILSFQSGYLSFPTVGSVTTYDISSDDRGFVYAVIACSPGDRFKVNVTGAGSSSGGGARAYAFFDAGDKAIAMSDRNVTVNGILTAPSGAAKIVINNMTSSNANYYAIKLKPSTDIPNYWASAVSDGIARANRTIYDAGVEESFLFITDPHWRANQKHSPALAKKILDSCNIQWFINGGDLLESHLTSSKYDAADEIQDCINSFKDCRLPMITLYGNHDRNRNANSEHEDTFLSFNEHFNLVNKSFAPNPYIKYTGARDSFYWDTENYRIICLYWYYSDSRAVQYASELFDTDLPVIVFCHGIYISCKSNTSEDVIDNGWILAGLEPYKTQIRCIIQGHAHQDALRYAWSTVPIIILDCDRTTPGTETTDEEQALSIITINSTHVYVTRIGYGDDFYVTDGTPIFQTTQQSERSN